MNDLVELYNKKEPVVKTFDIFNGFGYKTHSDLKRVITRNRDRFENQGLLVLQNQKPIKGSKGGRPEESFLLTERQFTLLVMLAKNTLESIDLKEKVVNEFFRMKTELMRIASNQTNEQWIEQRNSGKISRRHETDVIKEFIEYAKSQGGSKKGCDMYYSNISKMENKHLFMVEQKYKNLRDVLGVADLSTIQNADHIVSKALKHGMSEGMNYRDIYALCKDRVIMFAELRGVSQIGLLPSK